MRAYPLIEGKGLGHFFKEGEFLFCGLDLQLHEGEIYFLTGASGTGKSTLLKILNGLILPSRGDLRFNEESYAKTDLRMLRKKVQLLTQTPVFFEGTVEENLKEVLPAADSVLQEMMERFQLTEDLLSQNASTLSGGQASRVAAVRALLLEPEVLLLDEPTSSLDKKNKSIFIRNIRRYVKEKDASCLWVTHEDFGVKAGKNKLRLSHADCA